MSLADGAQMPDAWQGLEARRLAYEAIPGQHTGTYRLRDQNGPIRAVLYPREHEVAQMRRTNRRK